MKATARSLLAECAGTAALLATVVGSGIMGEALAQGNAAVALLANSIATGATLYVLITVLAPISGAHFNPLVSALLWWRGACRARTFVAYAAMQMTGAIFGVWLEHAMFDLPLLEVGAKARTGVGQWLSEVVASAGLLATIVLASREHARSTAALVASYIVAAYWFTASTSFANPAVTIARGLTATFAGIRLIDVPAFILAQCAGMLVVAFTMAALGHRRLRSDAHG
jgi:glycerol uptake facilitator-like aquaporin